MTRASDKYTVLKDLIGPYFIISVQAECVNRKACLDFINNTFFLITEDLWSLGVHVDV